MTVWGGIWGLPGQENNVNTSISKEEMRKLQVCQNKIMRLICGRDYSTPTQTLLEKTKQLSVHQQVAFHSACQVYKIRRTKLPVYHYDRLFEKDGNAERIKPIHFNLTLGKSNFFYQSATLWSILPHDIQVAPTISVFKKKCKAWIKENISIRP